MLEKLKKEALERARPIRPEPFVAILMAVKNGAHLLPEQLDSISAQTHQNWHLYAADDISSDTSTSLIRDFADQSHRVTLMDGPGTGSANNFMYLVTEFTKQAPKDSWLAFCDQDDVWLPDRLARGVRRLYDEPADRPALYCSRTWVCDANLENLHLSPACPRPPDFLNALVQNIAAGNTILLNPAGVRLLARAAAKAGPVVSHDWWAYQIISGAGGTVIYDDVPTLLYRQHANNIIGSNLGIGASLYRLKMVLKGRYRGWNDTNIATLQRSADCLTAENRAALAAFARLRKAPLPARLLGLRRTGLFRQRRLGQMALWVAALLNRM